MTSAWATGRWKVPLDKTSGEKWRGIGPCINLSVIYKKCFGTKEFHCKFSVLWLLLPPTTVDFSSRQQETNNTGPRQWKGGKYAKCRPHHNKFKASAFLCSTSPPFPAWKSQLEWKARSSVTKGIPRPWRINSNKQTQKDKGFFQGQKYSGGVQVGRQYGKQRRFDILLGWQAHIAYIPDGFISRHWTAHLIPLLYQVIKNRRM